MSSTITNLLGKFGVGSNSLGGALKNKFVFKNLTYPDDINNIGGGINHCMLFNIYVRASSKSAKFRPTVPGSKINASNFGIPTPSSLVRKGASALGLTGNQGVANAVNGVQNAVTQSGVETLVNQLVELKESIVLYIPHDLRTTEGQDWQDESFATSEYLAQSSDAIDFMKRWGQNTAINFGKKVLSRLSGSDELTNAASKISGRIINPYYELLYGGPSFRTFNFNFKFTPQTAKDAKRVRDIIRTFRYHQAPEIDDTLDGRFLLYPSEFRISYLSYGEDNKFINKIGRCVLTGITTNYTGATAAAFHSDGSPISYTLDLTFKELEIVTKESIGLPDADYGDGSILPTYQDIGL
jgi:hypothetical protein